MCVHALITSSYTLLLFSLLRRFSASKLLRLPKKSILLNATKPLSADSALAYSERSRSACRESVCRATSISSVDMFSCTRRNLLLPLMKQRIVCAGSKPTNYETNSTVRDNSEVNKLPQQENYHLCTW